MENLILSPGTVRREDRLPPGQKWRSKPLVYDIVRTRPHLEAGEYKFRLWGLVEKPLEMTYAELKALGHAVVLADFHCVTHWSVKDIFWGGVQSRKLLELSKPKPAARFVMVHCLDSYTTNMPMDYLWKTDVLLAWEMDKQEILPEHGYPLRLVVPELYAWKSAKYVCGIELKEKDEPGFWEERGYHMLGDPWKEERYSR